MTQVGGQFARANFQLERPMAAFGQQFFSFGDIFRGIAAG
jgi:hypothetical protein